jgi:hypothetical protein
VIYRSALAMDQRIREAAASNRSVLFDDVLAMWQQAGLDVAARKDIPNALLGAVRSPPMTLLDAWANRPGAANWQTLIQGHVANAAQEADAIVGAAIRNGASMQDLARNLQRYVKGSEAFQDAFKAVKRADGSEVWRLDRAPSRPSSGGCDRDAPERQRIAVTEIHSARREAEYLHFVADPLIYAVKWSLAPDRGTHGGEADICDVLATADAYGMGPGVFPLDRVPPIPHPEDRCERDPLERSVKHAGRRSRCRPAFSPSETSPFRAPTTAHRSRTGAHPASVGRPHGVHRCGGAGGPAGDEPSARERRGAAARRDGAVGAFNNERRY